ncbi:hypothetical protein KL905_002064 [Ogataea polymorpha]|nr:hypothetical protein KL937_001917 [Ogataea polymorpha]KAG7893808.1 hypothetical protein KL908_002862 [Ogataea polymorpha]KAG7901431.1 hypothetical protein KL935_002497 [Ogataea polymorpha]KAG7909684.1 hypothetical protein KL906_002440 [Ogataea polymorpha]KAG7917206.1 hypothetical protein KL927_002980 [Ogataea polymorpha]
MFLLDDAANNPLLQVTGAGGLVLCFSHGGISSNYSAYVHTIASYCEFRTLSITGVKRLLAHRPCNYYAQIGARIVVAFACQAHHWQNPRRVDQSWSLDGA